MNHWLRQIGLTASLLLLCPMNTSAEESGCVAKPSNSRDELRADMKKGGTDKDSYGVLGLGNATYLLDEELNPVSPKELGSTMIHDKKFEAAGRVVLIWSYSGWGDAYFAHELEKIVKKPVKGFSGPAWWYPDGAVIASRTSQSSHQEPDESNVAECITPSGKYTEGEECKSLIKTHPASKAILTNMPFLRSCDELNKMNRMGEQGNAQANLMLYFYHDFVDIDSKKASQELEVAAKRGNPLANYLMAQTMKRKSPPDKKRYSAFLERAALLGNKKAKEDIMLLVPQ